MIERETRIRVAARKPSFLIERGKKREVIMITRENYKQESEGTLHVGWWFYRYTGTQRNVRMLTYTHIYVSQLLLLVKGYWCWHFQCKMLLLLFRYKFYMSLSYTKIIAEIFLPSNLLSIQRTNANAHISMNFWKKDARH